MSEKALNSFKKLYLQKDYMEAKKWLQSNKDQFEQSVYHYNLGTIHYKLQEFPEARLYFELAMKEGLYTPSLFKNLQQTKNVLKIQEFEKPQTPLDYWYQGGSEVSLIPLACLFFMVSIPVILGKYLKKISLLTGTILMILGALPLALKVFYFNQFQYMIPLTKQNIFEGPSKIFEVTSYPPPGAKLLVKKQEGDWLKVLSPTHGSGWIEKKKFQPL